MLENIEEGCGDNNQDNDDNGGLSMCEGDLVLSNSPKVFVWSNKLDFAVDSLIKVKLDEGDPKDTLEAVENFNWLLGISKGWWLRHAGTRVTMSWKS